MAEVDIERLVALAGSGKGRKKRVRNGRIGSRIAASERDTAENMELLYACANDWQQLEPRRREHERFVRYMNGQQWDDYVEDPDCPHRMIQEKELISRTGVTPVTNNIIQQFVRNILGQMLSNKYQTVVQARRNEDSELAEMLTNTIQACLDVNQNATLDINHVITLLSMGISWGKITYTKWDDRNDTDGRVSFVNENRIAWNQDCEDPRLLDLRRITELHSYTIDELVSNFATSPADERTLREMYRNHSFRNEEANARAADVLGTLDFWGNTAEQNKCRIIEVWQKRGRWVLWIHDRATAELPKEYTEQFELHEREADAENERRRMQAAEAGLDPEEVEDTMVEYERYFEEYWWVKYLTPQGVCLLEMESPYKHQQHPYVFASMPIVDGQSKSLLSDLIDMQRNINRQRTLLDAIIAGSAKNTLMVPVDALEGRDPNEYVQQMMKVNGVIFYTPKPGVTAMPEFLSRNSTNIGIWDVLNFDMAQAKEISGLSGALQGQVAKTGTPSSLYAQQAQNAMLNFVLLFDRFNEFCTKRDDKLLKVLIQYYNRPRHLALSGREYASTAKEYIPEKAARIANDYSLVASQSMDTPVFRQRIDDYLMQLLQMGLPLDIFLEYTTLPFGKKLLAQMKSLQQQQQQGQQMDPATVDAIQQEAMASGEVNPRAQQMLQQAFGASARPDLLPQQPV